MTTTTPAVTATFGSLTKAQHSLNEFKFFTSPEMQLLGNINNGKVFTFKNAAIGVDSSVNGETVDINS